MINMNLLMSSVWNIFCFNTLPLKSFFFLIVQMFHGWYFTFRALPFVRDCQEYFCLNFTQFSACFIVFSTKFMQFKALLKIKKIWIIAWKNHEICRCLLNCLIYEFHVWTADYRITSQLKMQRTHLRLESLVVLFVFPFTLQQALPKRAILRASQ